MTQFLKQSVNIGDIVRIWTPIIIGGIGVSALLGWVFEQDLLIRYFNDHISIKPYTAISAVLASLIIITKGSAKKWLSISLLVIMGRLILGYLEIIISGHAITATQIESVSDNLPSVATIIMYSLMVYCTQCSTCALRGGRIILWLSAIAMVGHIFGCSLMYWYVPSMSSGMSAPTALIGIHIGFWMTHGYNNTLLEAYEILHLNEDKSVGSKERELEYM